MDYVRIILQVIVGLSILNVWLIQNKKETQWRGGNAKTIMEEFSVYGLPEWMCYVVGGLKVLLAIGLLAGIWFPEFVKPAALGLAALLTGSIVMHLKINDPWKKSFPALLFLVMCIYLASPIF